MCIGKAPKVPDPPPVPKPEDPEIETKRRERKAVLRLAAGRDSTITIGGLGDTSAAPVSKKVLLGGSG